MTYLAFVSTGIVVGWLASRAGFGRLATLGLVLLALVTPALWAAPGAFYSRPMKLSAQADSTTYRIGFISGLEWSLEQYIAGKTPGPVMGMVACDSMMRRDFAKMSGVRP